VEVRALAALVPEVLSCSPGTGGSSGSIGADEGDQGTGYLVLSVVMEVLTDNGWQRQNRRLPILNNS